MGEDNRLAPPGGMLLNIDRLPGLDRPGELAQPRPDRREELTETRSGGPRAVAGTVPSVAAPGRPPAAEPSWGRVLATTLRLWLRRQVTVRRWRTVGVVAAAVVTVAALALSGVFSGTAAPAARVRAASTPSPAQATTHPTTAPSVARPSPVQTAAAAWIASQLSSDATIGCDPVMCTALQAQGVTAARLMPLEPGSPGSHGATMMVTSDAAAAQYAPAVIATFGSGAAQVDVRATEPGGAAAYQTALRADQAARMSAGSQLLRNNRIHFTAQDAAQLRAGQVDARLLATLAALSSQYSFSVTAFGDASPGVAMLCREVTVAAAGQDLTAALALLKAQVPPFLPTQAAIMHLAAGPAVLSIEYAAPSPLGLLTAVLDVATRR